MSHVPSQTPGLQPDGGVAARKSALSERQATQVALFVVGTLLGALVVDLVFTWVPADSVWTVVLAALSVLAAMFFVLPRAAIFAVGGPRPSRWKLTAAVLCGMAYLVLQVWASAQPWTPVLTVAVIGCLWIALALLTWPALSTRRRSVDVAIGHGLVLSGIGAILLGVIERAGGWGAGGLAAVLCGVATAFLGASYWADGWSWLALAATLLGVSGLVLGWSLSEPGWSALGVFLLVLGAAMILFGLTLAAVSDGFLADNPKARVWLRKLSWLKVPDRADAEAVSGDPTILPGS